MSKEYLKRCIDVAHDELYQFGLTRAVAERVVQRVFKVSRLSECPDAVEALGLGLMERFKSNPGVQPAAPEFHAPELLCVAENAAREEKP